MDLYPTYLTNLFSHINRKVGSIIWPSPDYTPAPIDPDPPGRPRLYPRVDPDYTRVDPAYTPRVDPDYTPAPIDPDYTPG